MSLRLCQEAIPPVPGEHIQFVSYHHSLRLEHDPGPEVVAVQIFRPHSRHCIRKRFRHCSSLVKGTPSLSRVRFDTQCPKKEPDVVCFVHGSCTGELTDHWSG